MSSYTKRSWDPASQEVASYVFKNENDYPLLKIVRFKRSDGERDFRSFHLEDSTHGKQWVMGGPDGPRIPYHLPEIISADPATPIHIGEGEKDADSLTAIGLVGTTNAFGAKNWHPDLNKWFVGKKTIFIHQDNDEAGRARSRNIASALALIVPDVRIVKYEDLPEGGDVTDWLNASHTKEDLIARCEAASIFKPHNRKAPTSTLTPVMISALELFNTKFDPIKYVVPELVVEGLTLFAGKPKIGKSWLWLEVGLAVACGGSCLGSTLCEQGDVLYLALEDNHRRLHARIRKLWEMAVGKPSERLTFTNEWRRPDEGGLDDIRQWIDDHPEARLVIVDVLQMFRPLSKPKDQTSYEADYNNLKALQHLALEKHVGIVVIHHTRKSAGVDDPYEEISGTLGLNGAADTMMVLRRDGNGHTLHTKGRDVETSDKAVRFEAMDCKWVILGDAEDVHGTDERNQLLRVLAQATEPMGPGELAAALSKTVNAVNHLLHKMVPKGEVVRNKRGKYSHPRKEQEHREDRKDRM